MPTERQITILKLIALHYVLSASQFKRLLFRPEEDPDGRITRRLLSTAARQRLLNKTRCEVVNPVHGLTCPVYYPSRLGCEILAVATGEPRYQLAPTQTPAWQNLRHWTILSDVRILFDAAVRSQSAVSMPAFFNEFDVVNTAAEKPEERYGLYTLIQKYPRRLCCVPDAGFQLTMNGASRSFYVELETGANPPRKAAAEKLPGYNALAQQRLHTRHFPNATDFRVLCLAPDSKWRDALRRAVDKKDGAHLWKFAALSELSEQHVLHAPLFFPAGDGDPTPLVRGGGA